MKSFIDEEKIQKLLNGTKPDKHLVRAIIQKSLSKQRLELEDTAALLRVEDPEFLSEIFSGAKELKEKIYGNRIVLFAPLYVGNDCVNDCVYCAFRISNKEARRRTLSDQELKKEIETLESHGQKRLILVFGEHPKYDADFMARAVRTAYATKFGKGEIRRVNINAAPMEVEGYKKLKEVGIGTYQIFQETYHRKTYELCHPSGKKSDFLWRLYGLDRAQEAGLAGRSLGFMTGGSRSWGFYSIPSTWKKSSGWGRTPSLFPGFSRPRTQKSPKDMRSAMMILKNWWLYYASQFPIQG